MAFGTGATGRAVLAVADGASAGGLAAAQPALIARSITPRNRLAYLAARAWPDPVKVRSRHGKLLISAPSQPDAEWRGRSARQSRSSARDTAGHRPRDEMCAPGERQL